MMVEAAIMVAAAVVPTAANAVEAAVAPTAVKAEEAAVAEVVINEEGVMAEVEVARVGSLG